MSPPGRQDAAPAGAAPLVSIIGGGAIGGLLAALLARAGRPVELVVRQERLAALEAGLRVTSPTGSFRHFVTLRTAPSPQAALLVLTVKLPDLDALCRRLAATSDGTAPTVLLLQNGLEAPVMAARYLPPQRLIGAVVELGAVALRAGEIDYAIPGRLVLGVPPGGDPARARAAAALLAPAVRTVLTPNLAAAQRLKLVVNLNNGAAAATGLAIQQLYNRRAGVALSLQLMREALAVLAAAGLPLEHSSRSLAFRAYLALPDALAVPLFRLISRRRLGRMPFYSSTLQSLRRGRPTEVLALNGAIVRLGEVHGVPAPGNRTVTAAVTAISAADGEFVTPEALLRAAGAATAGRLTPAGAA